MFKNLLIVFFIIITVLSIYSEAYENIYITGETNSRLLSEKGGLASFFELGISKEKDLIVDTGNIIFPNRFTFPDKGEKVIDLYKQAGFSFSVLSNHDFDFGMENMKKLKNSIELISTNYSGLKIIK